MAATDFTCLAPDSLEPQPSSRPRRRSLRPPSNRHRSSSRFPMFRSALKSSVPRGHSIGWSRTRSRRLLLRTPSHTLFLRNPERMCPTALWSFLPPSPRCGSQSRRLHRFLRPAFLLIFLPGLTTHPLSSSRQRAKGQMLRAQRGSSSLHPSPVLPFLGARHPALSRLLAFHHPQRPPVPRSLLNHRRFRSGSLSPGDKAWSIRQGCRRAGRISST